MSYKFPAIGEKNIQNDIEIANISTESNINDDTSNNNNEGLLNEEGDRETSAEENITIQIMNPTPVNSLNLSDSSDMEHLLSSSYRGTDNISKEIRRATASTNTDTSDYLFNHTRVEIKQKPSCVKPRYRSIFS